MARAALGPELPAEEGRAVPGRHAAIAPANRARSEGAGATLRAARAIRAAAMSRAIRLETIARSRPVLAGMSETGSQPSRPSEMNRRLTSRFMVMTPFPV